MIAIIYDFRRCFSRHYAFRLLLCAGCHDSHCQKAAAITRLAELGERHFQSADATLAITPLPFEADRLRCFRRFSR
jgi:hypothetical protein